MEHHRRHARTVGGAALLSAALLASGVAGARASGSAGPGPDAPGSVSAEVWANQARLVQAADDVRGVMESRDASFAGVAIDPEADAMTVYLHGSPDARSSAQLQKLRGQGFRLTVGQAPYSRATLDAARERVLAQQGSLGIVGAGINEDGTGLAVGTHVADTGTGAKAGGTATRGVGAAGPAASVVPQVFLANVAGVPVTVTQEQVAPTAGNTRLDDGSPFKGGARLVGPGLKGKTVDCTSSFAVKDSANKTYLVTAGHCFAQGPTKYITGGTDLTLTGVVGSVSWNGLTSGKKIDAELIRTDAAGYVYDGAYNDGNGYNKPVAGSSNTVVGMHVCVSGSFSGVACNAKVTSRGYAYQAEGLPYPVVGDMIGATDGKAIAGEGDSGSPVFTVTPADNYRRDTVVGILSAGNAWLFNWGVVGCKGVTTTDAGKKRQCYNTMLIARFNNLKIDTGVVPVTVP
jgi:hypothetical protein